MPFSIIYRYYKRKGVQSWLSVLIAFATSLISERQCISRVRISEKAFRKSDSHVVNEVPPFM
jgi:hypothetical protein